MRRYTAVWNPWVAKSAAMGDFGDEEYTGMVCVEAAAIAAPVWRCPLNPVLKAPGCSA